MGKKKKSASAAAAAALADFSHAHLLHFCFLYFFFFSFHFLGFSFSSQRGKWENGYFIIGGKRQDVSHQVKPFPIAKRLEASPSQF